MHNPALAQNSDPEIRPAGSAQPRLLLAAGLGSGALAAASLFLWMRYGEAAYFESVIAGLGLCF